MLLFNSLPTDLEDKAYSNLTIPSILGYSSFVTSSHYLPSQTLFFGAWVSLHKNPCLRRQLLWEKTTRCTWKTYDSRPLLLIRVDDGSTVEFRGTKMFSLWRRDHSAMPINHQLRRGTNPFDVLLWHIKHASKHGLVLSWIQNTTWLSKWRNCHSNTAQLLFAESRTTYWIPTGIRFVGTWMTMEVDSLLGHSTGSRCHSMAEAFSQEKAKAMINSLSRGLVCVVLGYDIWEDANWWFITGQLARYMDDRKCRSPLIKRTLEFSMSTGNTKWWKDVTLAKTWSHVVGKTSQWKSLLLISRAIKASDMALERTPSLRECFLFCGYLTKKTTWSKSFKTQTKNPTSP